MGRKTVGMLTSYQGVNQSDWLWQQTPHPFGVWQNIQILKNAPNPDFLLLYQYDFFTQPPQRKSWLSRFQPKSQTTSDRNQLEHVTLSEADLRGVPKARSIYLLREPPLDEIIHKNQINYDAASQYCDYVSGPDDMAPTPDYMPAIWYHANSFRDLDQMASPEKVNPCSWITSGINRTENHRKRLAFLSQLQQSGIEVDLYGRGLPKGVVSGGELKNKWYGMAPYYYNLAIENYADNDWYVSEKMWDSLLAWCLPIYYGGSAADRLLPPGSFLRLPSLDEKGVAYIREVTSSPEAWYAAKEAIAEARQIILHKLNLLNWLSEFVEKVS